MAFDDDLAGRIRTLLVDAVGVTEKRMFGGLAFMLNGHMAVAANSTGDLMVRTDPSDATAPYLAEAEPMVMRGRAMAGWLHLPGSAVADDGTLAAVVAHGLAFARTLPAK